MIFLDRLASCVNQTAYKSQAVSLTLKTVGTVFFLFTTNMTHEHDYQDVCLAHACRETPRNFRHWRHLHTYLFTKLKLPLPYRSKGDVPETQLFRYIFSFKKITCPVSGWGDKSLRTMTLSEVEVGRRGTGKTQEGRETRAVLRSLPPRLTLRAEKREHLQGMESPSPPALRP